MKTDPKVVWQNDNTRIVVWYGSLITGGPKYRYNAVEKAKTKDALGELNWRKIIIPNGVHSIVEGFLDQLGISKEKYPDNES